MPQKSLLLFVQDRKGQKKTYRTRKQVRADDFDYIERFYNPNRRHSAIGDLSPITFEERAMKAEVALHETGIRA